MLCLRAATVFAADGDDDFVEYFPEDPDPAAAPIEADSGPPPLRFEASLQGMLSVPSESGYSAFGFAVTYGMGYADIPLMLGLDFMSAGGGSAGSFRVTASEPGQASEFHKQADSKTLYFDVWLRLQPRRWAVRPYLEGFAGARLAMLRYSLTLPQATTDPGSSGTDEEWSSSLGYGAGVDFAGLLHLADALSITLGVRRLHGARTAFTLDGNVAGQHVQTEHEVAGSVVMFMAGITTWLDLAPAQ